MMEIEQYLPFLIVLNSFSSEVDLDLFLRIQKTFMLLSQLGDLIMNKDLIAEHRYIAPFPRFLPSTTMWYLKQEAKIPKDQ